jgi:hypothetical protein
MKVSLSTLTCFLVAMSAPAADWKNVESTQKWQGSVDGEPKDGGVPVTITNAADFAAVWKTCGRAEAVPEIDWTKNVAVLVTTRGSNINLRARIDGAGNLVTSGMATRDIRPGHRYSLGIFPREGVTAVNGVKL